MQCVHIVNLPNKAKIQKCNEQIFITNKQTVKFILKSCIFKLSKVRPAHPYSDYI